LRRRVRPVKVEWDLLANALLCFSFLVNSAEVNREMTNLFLDGWNRIQPKHDEKDRAYTDERLEQAGSHH
jgi:hypothetical protein